MNNGNLLNLFLLVKENGGFEAVSKNGLWGLVAEQSGLGSGSGLSVASRLKSVYVKYLDVLERWLGEAVEAKKRGLSCCFMELEAELKRILSDGLSEQQEVEEVVECGHLSSKVLDIEERKETKFPQADVVMKLDDGDDYGEIHNDGRLDAGKDCVGSVACLHSDVKSSMLCESTGNPCRKKPRTEMAELDVNSKGKEMSSFEFTECQTNFSDVSIPCSKDRTSFQKSTSTSQEEIVCNKDESKCEEVDSNETKKSGDDNDDDLMVLDPVQEKARVSHKRKRDSLWTMLCWITGIAKNPCDIEVDSLPDRSKWKSCGNEYWKKILLAREATFSKQHMDPGADQMSWQRNQRMHPSMYEDHGSGYKEKLRCRESLFSKRKASGEGGTLYSSSIQNDLNKSAGKKKYLDKQLSGSSELTTVESIFDDHVEQVPLGAAFQAVIPEWTGLVSESESKWLGTRIWPPEKRKHVIERDPIGKGRQNSCGCQLPGSNECFRLHIAQKRLKSKLELGSAFYHWKFDKMGEEVGLSWTKDQEKKFKALVELNPPSFQKSFWGDIFKAFRTKSREELVSYYFNVFLLKRRGYQNRVTPGNINSDDDDESVWDME